VPPRHRCPGAGPGRSVERHRIERGRQALRRRLFREEWKRRLVRKGRLRPQNMRVGSSLSRLKREHAGGEPGKKPGSSLSEPFMKSRVILESGSATSAVWFRKGSVLSRCGTSFCAPDPRARRPSRSFRFSPVSMSAWSPHQSWRSSPRSAVSSTTESCRPESIDFDARSDCVGALSTMPPERAGVARTRPRPRPGTRSARTNDRDSRGGARRA